jgi:hypothetical protein
MRLTPIALLTISALCVSAAVPAEAQPRTAALRSDAAGAGVFYPKPKSFETADIRFAAMEGVGPQQRQVFADQINLAASQPGRAVPIVAQAVGEGHETLVFMYLESEGAGMTPYLARGILARLTSITRIAPAITEMGLSNAFDIYNMAAVLGFERIVVTDGRAFSHEASLPSK